ncbi:MAG: polyprenyl synthetase family protein [Prevotellaceae bacterium]|jgi:octaprenyl-diphosphate synthase|nr:polyprenyl synthetase family protein [Prevotellaceae bacterium]
MNNLETIKQPVHIALQQFEAQYADTLKSDNPLLNQVVGHVLSRKGKQIRPILVLLSAEVLGGIMSETLSSAVSLELLHMATLIHDDVVDETLERRGMKSVNAVWNNKVAVLSGDYFLSKSLNEIAKTRNFAIMSVISTLGEKLSNGELLQLDAVRQSQISEELYFDIIKKKTAVLFAACCEAGALSVPNVNVEMVEKLTKFGELLGVCFQLKDDIFDYFPSTEIGKPTGNDIGEGKITLPLIYAINNAPTAVRENILQIIKNADFSEKNVQKLYAFAIENGGIGYAKTKMQELKLTANALLADLPDSPAKNALLACAEYVVERSR